MPEYPSSTATNHFLRKRIIGSRRTLAVLALLVAACASGASPRSEIRQGTDFLLWSDGRLEILSEDSLVRARFFKPFVADSTVVTGALRWEIAYEDLAASSATGFADPSLGAARRAAFEDAIRIVGDTLRSPRAATLQVRVNPSVVENSATLASAATSYPPSGPAFLAGHLATHIQSGVDPDPAGPDLGVEFNFFHSFHLGSGNPPAGMIDIRSVAVHEIGHALGLSSLVSADGRSRRTSTNPGIFTTYDSLLVSAAGSALMASGGRFVGSTADLIGANGGELRWRGAQASDELARAPLVYTPAVFEVGSSISHFSSTERNAVMQFSISPGLRRRMFDAFEIAALRDLGYAGARAPDDGLLAFAPRAAFGAAGRANSTLITNFDDKPGLDLLILEDSPAGSVLRVYSGTTAAGTRSQVYPLGDTFVRMAAARVGPRLQAGLVLSSSSEGSLLALGGLHLPTNRLVLEPSDFDHIHRVTASSVTENSAYSGNPQVAVADMNDDGNLDVVTLARRQGPITFYGDGNGYFDRLIAPHRYPDLERANPALDLSAFTDAIVYGQPRLALEVPYGMYAGGEIAAVDPVTGAQRRLSLSNPMSGYRIAQLARFSTSGYAALQPSSPGDTLFARLSLESDGRFRATPLRGYPQITDIALAAHPDDPAITSFWFTTGSGHTVEYLANGAAMPQTAAGSTRGYRNGPAVQAQFDNPTALCAGRGAVYVADYGNALIRRIDYFTRAVTTVAGVQGQRTLRDGPRGTGSFNFIGSDPGSCAVIGDSLYVLDGHNPSSMVVRKVNLANGYVTTLSDPGFPGLANPKSLQAWQSGLYVLHWSGTKIAIESANAFPFAPRALEGAVPHPTDVDGDGRLDLLVPLLPQSRSIDYLRATGDGGYQWTGQTTFDQAPNSIETRDMDGDGRVDMVVGLPGSVRVMIQGSGRFIEDIGARVATNDATWMQLVDANFDGRADLAWIDTRGDLRIVVADEAGRWTANGPGEYGEHYRKRLGVLNPRWFNIADLDNDRDFEILVLPENGTEVSFFSGKPAP